MVLYRHATFGSPLRTEPARQAGRYHIGGEPSPTQYLCLHPLGPFAEFLRAHGLRLPEQVVLVLERTWALRLEHDELIEISFDNAHEYDLEPEALVEDSYARCQAFAAELRGTGVSGIIVPNAALPGTRNVVLFGPRVGSPYQVDAVGPFDVPASITADASRPPISLRDLVRFRGEQHAGFVAWQEGDSFEFEEPDWEVMSSRS